MPKMDDREWAGRIVMVEFELIVFCEQDKVGQLAKNNINVEYNLITCDIS